MLRAASRAAERQWNDAKASEQELITAVRDRLTTGPMDRSDNPNRTHRLKPPLDLGVAGQQKLPQWQHEFSAAGRIWYGIDQVEHTVWITRVSLGPPRETH